MLGALITDIYTGETGTPSPYWGGKRVVIAYHVLIRSVKELNY